MSRNPLITLILVGLAGLWGCDDGQPDPCEGVESLCETDGEARCSADDGAIEACRPNADGCLVWSVSRSCDEGCDDSGATPVCVEGCVDACLAGASRCLGEVIQACDEQADGCTAWVPGVDCAASGQYCDDSGDEPVCAEESCTDECTLGASRCEGTTIATCEEQASGCTAWVQGEDCAESDATCDDSGAEAVCETESCTDLCVLDALQCAGEVIQSCDLQADGCTAWVDLEDCAASDQLCDDSGTEVVCAEAPCTSECATLDATRCAGDVVETCEAAADGCSYWVAGLDCTVAADRCDDSTGAAECVTDTPSGAGTCADPVVVSSFPFVDSGADFTAVYDHDMVMTGPGCRGSGSTQPEAVYAVPLLAGQAFAVSEHGTMDAVTSIQRACGEAEACVVHWDDPDTTVHTYRAPVDETVYVVVETFSATPSASYLSYEVRIDLVPDEVCDDGTDNDLDGRTDCDDPDCFGIAPCTTETVCSDGLDNDADGLTDCDDPDCDAAAYCTAYATCTNPIVVSSFPFVDSGTDFTADYFHHMVLSGAGCTSRTSTQPEAVYEVSLAAGETIGVSEHGSIDVVMSIQPGACGATAACYASWDSPETTIQRYTAPVDETVYVVVETYSATPYSWAYEVRIVLIEPEICDDGVDNDVDGTVDCGDSDCFGIGPCTTETACSDGLDNDADGLIDCADPDCATAAPCIPFSGVYETFLGSDPIDLQGHSVTFTPNPSNPMGYDWAVAGGVTDFAVAPGTGTVSTTLALTDDSSREHALTVMGDFTFYGATYTSFHVGSNGYVTFGSSMTAYSATATNFFSRPIVAPLFTDLNPSASSAPGTVYVDELADRVAVTWDGVVRYGTTDPNDLQVVLWDDGTVEIHWVLLAAPVSSRDNYVGIGAGPGLAPYPPETDFVP